MNKKTKFYQLHIKEKKKTVILQEKKGHWELVRSMDKTRTYPKEANTQSSHNR